MLYPFNVHILHNQGAFVKTNIGTILLTLFRIHQFPHTYSFSIPGSNVGYHLTISNLLCSVSSDLRQLLCLVFHDLDSLKSIIGQVFCKMSLNLGLSEVFSLLAWDYGIWG